MPKLIEPTPDEKRNGWTAETLTAYLEKRTLAQSAVILNTVDHVTKVPARGFRKPQAANSKYSPHRWRGA